MTRRHCEIWKNAYWKDLDDSIKTRDAEHTTVDDLYEQFMDIRKDLRESSRCCCNDIYRKHIKPVTEHRPIGRVKPTNSKTVSGYGITLANKDRKEADGERNWRYWQSDVAISA